MGFFQSVKAQIAKSRSSSTSPTTSGTTSPKVDGKSDVSAARKAAAKLCSRKDFLSVVPGQDFNSGRYVVKTKLGAGSYSEVWLASDRHSGDDVAIKVLSNDFYNGGTELWELEILSRLQDKAQTSRHPGRHHVATLIDHFEHPASPRPHVCMVMELLGASIEDQFLASKRSRLPYQTCKRLSTQLLQALDFVHTECGVLHTDITIDNVLMSRGSAWNEDNTIDVRLVDFGTASWVDRHLTDRVQRPLFRAPEVTLNSLWDTSADIFDLGCFIYQIVTGSEPFPGNRGRDVGSVIGEQDRLRQLTKLFGPIPDVVLNEAARRKDFFDEDGSLRRSLTRDSSSVSQIDGIIDGRSRATSLGNEMPAEDIPVFCDLLRNCLATDPRERKTAEALLDHPWLETQRRPIRMTTKI